MEYQGTFTEYLEAFIEYQEAFMEYEEAFMEAIQAAERTADKARAQGRPVLAEATLKLKEVYCAPPHWSRQHARAFGDLLRWFFWTQLVRFARDPLGHRDALARQPLHQRPLPPT